MYTSRPNQIGNLEVGSAHNFMIFVRLSIYVLDAVGMMAELPAGYKNPNLRILSVLHRTQVKLQAIAHQTLLRLVLCHSSAETDLEVLVLDFGHVSLGDVSFE
jgi:hypothetical protein